MSRGRQMLRAVAASGSCGGSGPPHVNNSPPVTSGEVGDAVSPTAPGQDAEIADLQARVFALRKATELPDAKLRPALDAVLAELDVTVGLLRSLRSATATATATAAAAAGGGGGGGGGAAADAERRLLRAVFQEVPAPILLLERDGMVRRINRQAAALLGIDSGSASGKPFTALVHLHDRIAVKTHLTALLRSGRSRRIRCRMLSATGPLDTDVTVDVVRRPGPGPLIMAVLGSAVTPAAPAAADEVTAPGGTSNWQHAVAEATQRFDLLSAATRLLLENAAFSESVMLRRCAALLASELSAWVLVDMEQQGELRRVFVLGPAGEPFAEVARTIEDRDPPPDSLPWKVHHSGRAQLLAGDVDAGALGSGPSGVPVLQLLGASTVLCVPLSGSERSYGTLTLARRFDAGSFTVTDAELVDELAQHVGVAIKVGRMFLRRSAVTEALQASLLPRELPHVPGVDIATAYVRSTEEIGVGGDFYDVYPTPGGWGLTVGDVCGKGEEAAAVTATARHAIRIFAHWTGDPADVLDMANDFMNSQPGDHFVTAVAARLEWQAGLLRAVVASSGHPAPLLVRPDGRVRLLSGGGLPLGFFADSHPAVDRFDLEPGDILFFYSDGITEARSPDGAYFETRLADELAGLAGRPASHIVGAIRDCVLNFTDGNLRDDMSILVARVLDPPGEMPGNHRRADEVPGGGSQPRDEPGGHRHPDEAAAWN